MIDEINITKGDDGTTNDEEFVERPLMIDGIDITEGDDDGTMNNEEDTANPLIINWQDKEDQCTSAIEVEERSINIEESDLMRSEAMRKDGYRKRKSLASVLETIHRLQPLDQAKILRKCKESTDETAIETVFMSDVESVNEAKLV